MIKESVQAFLRWRSQWLSVGFCSVHAFSSLNAIAWRSALYSAFVKWVQSFNVIIGFLFISVIPVQSRMLVRIRHLVSNVEIVFFHMVHSPFIAWANSAMQVMALRRAFCLAQCQVLGSSRQHCQYANLRSPCAVTSGVKIGVKVTISLPVLSSILKLLSIRIVGTRLAEVVFLFIEVCWCFWSLVWNSIPALRVEERKESQN